LARYTTVDARTGLPLRECPPEAAINNNDNPGVPAVVCRTLNQKENAVTEKVLIERWGDSGPYGGYGQATESEPPSTGWWTDDYLKRVAIPAALWQRYADALDELREAEEALDGAYEAGEDVAPEPPEYIRTWSHTIVDGMSTMRYAGTVEVGPDEPRCGAVFDSASRENACRLPIGHDGMHSSATSAWGG
jgi:hypothetical protein